MNADKRRNWKERQESDGHTSSPTGEDKPHVIYFLFLKGRGVCLWVLVLIWSAKWKVSCYCSLNGGGQEDGVSKQKNRLKHPSDFFSENLWFFTCVKLQQTFYPRHMAGGRKNSSVTFFFWYFDRHTLWLLICEPPKARRCDIRSVAYFWKSKEEGGTAKPKFSYLLCLFYFCSFL